ncbi:signal peptidase I [Microlunatus capsulatus]|uniref:Signal peptidase I n=2 Tax=Microlunatus capsulatus TaxID=99117 RepID=A0ABS4ZC38_9ACTN|nr:hypothetical protein [Microlunatus capsulatus]MBP2418544.1 signal peptidase I [Microlunatus capsulatus]
MVLPAPAPPSRRLTAAARESALTLGAVAGVLCVLVVLAGAVLDLRPLVFRSGSMGPEIPTGSLALARTVPATALAVGDVVSVTDAAGRRVTHRVVGLSRAGDTAVLRLRGDANDVEDAQAYPVTEADRVIASVPRAGYVVAWLSSRPATFLGGLLVGVGAAWAFRGARSPADAGTGSSARAVPRVRAGRGARRAAAPTAARRRADPAPPAPSGRSPEARSGAVERRGSAGPPFAVLLVGLVLLPALRPADTAAAFTDAAPATSASLTSYTVPPPPALSCTGGLGTVTFTWPTGSGALDLVFVAGTRTATVSVPATQTSYVLTPGLLGTGSGTAVLQRRESFPALAPETTWTSLSSPSRTFTVLLGLLSGCS